MDAIPDEFVDLAQEKREELLDAASNFSDEIMVMRKGELVEHGPADEVILHPKEEYTKTLIGAAPDPERRLKATCGRWTVVSTVLAIRRLPDCRGATCECKDFL